MRRILPLFLFAISIWLAPKTFAQEYCIPSYATGCSVGDEITDVIMPDIGINNLNTDCDPDGYSDFTSDSSLQGDIIIGEAFDFTVTHDDFTQSLRIWIDLDGDGVFDMEDELLFDSASSAASHSGQIVIPLDAQEGITTMRVMSRFGTWAATNDSCTPGSAWGETHDYQVDLLPAADCPRPLGVNVDNITGVSAEVNFSGVDAAVNGYTWEVFGEDDDVEVDTPLFTGTIDAGEENATIDGLDSETTYQVVIISDCDEDGFSNPTNPVTFTTLEACVPPGTISVSGITESEVIINWSTVPNADNGYNWMVFAEGADPETDTPAFEGNEPSGSNSVTVTGLDAATSYEVYVMSDCDEDGESALSDAVFFTTLCDIFEAPYFENFNGSTWVPGTDFGNTDMEIDDCWDNDEPVAGFFWGTRAGDTNSGSTGPDDDVSGGGNYVYLRTSGGSEGSIAFLQGPPVDISDVESPVISFFYHMYGSAIGTLSLEVRELGEDDWDEVFSLSGEQQTSSSADWIQEFVVLDDYEDTSILEFRFLGERGSAFQGNMAVDDVFVGESPTCFDVDGLQVVSTGTDTADFEWEDNEDAIDGYIWEVYNSSDDIQTDDPIAEGTLDAGETTLTVTGLNASSSFILRLISDCGDEDGESFPGATVSFNTECDVVDAPYAENFDGPTWIPGTTFANGDMEIDECWENDEPVNGFFWGTRSGTTNSGSTGPDDDFNGGGNYVYLRTSSGVEGDVAFLEGPPVNLSPLEDPAFRFYYHMFGSAMGSLSVEVRVLGTTDWDEIFTISGQQQSSGTAPWEEVILDLTAYEGDIIQFRFLGERGSAFQGNMAVDNVSIDEAPTCFNITGFNVLGGTTTATITWNDSPSAIDGYILEIFNEGDDIDTDTPLISEFIDAGETEFEVTGLEEGTDYIATIQGDCGDDDFSEVNVTNFSTFSIGDTCGSAIEITSIPFTTTDDTANYNDFYDGAPGADCGATASYLSGNDVVYEYTPAQDEVVLVTMDPTASWSGIFVYESCDDIGSQCFAGEANSTTNIREFEMSLVAGQTYIFVISTWPAPQTTGFDFSLDPVLCGAVSGFEVDQVAGTEVDLVWDAVPGAVNYEWVVVVAGDDPEDEDDIVASGTTVDTQVTIDNLTGGTNYDAYIRSECDDEAFGNLTGPLNFQTNCEAETIPTEVEDFTGATFNLNTNDNFPCWNMATGQLPENGDSFTPTEASSGWTAGPYMNTATSPNGQSVYIPLNTFSNTFDWVISQVIDLGDGEITPFIEFDRALITNVFNDPIVDGDITSLGNHKIHIVVSTDAGNSWSFDDIVFTYDDNNVPSFNEIELVSLDGYTGIVRIAYYVERVSLDSPNARFYLDNFRVIPEPDCFPVSNIESSQVGVNETEISWSAAGEETQWEIQFGLQGFELESDEATSLIVEDNPVAILEDLPSSSNIDVYVRAVCDEEALSDWRGPEQFRSPIVPIEIPDGGSHNEVYCYGNNEFTEWLFVSVADPIEEDIIMIWNAGSVEDLPNSDDVLRIYDGFSDEGDLLWDTSVDGAVLAGLEFESTTGAFYMILTTDIAQSCQGGQGELPEEFDILVSSQNTISTEDFDANNFNYYPNPVKNVLTVDAVSIMEKIEIFDITGKRVHTLQPNTTQTQINLQNEPTGVYLMKVEINGDVESFKVVKE